MQRRKGQVGEREARAFLQQFFGDCVAARNLSQSRDGGADLALDLFSDFKPVVEVKRRQSIVVHGWHDQAMKAAGEGGDALVMFRGDNRKWLIALDAEVFCRIVRSLAAAKLEEHEAEQEALRRVRPGGSA